MDGATKLKTTEFASAIIENMQHGRECRGCLRNGGHPSNVARPSLDGISEFIEE